MSYDVTTYLGLRKPVRGSGQQYDSDVYSADLQSIDAFAVTTDGRLDALEGAGGNPSLGSVPTLAALIALSPPRGSQYSVYSAAYTGLGSDILFLRVSGAWKLISPQIVFATKANLDTFVTAASAYFSAGQTFWTSADSGYLWLWNGTTVEPARIRQGTTAPTTPVAGQLWVDTTP